MTFRRVSQAPFRSRTQKRATTWLDVPITSTNFTGIGGTLLVSLTALELAKRPFTIVRAHLEMQLSSDQAVASEIMLGAIGFAVVSDQAFGVGVTAVPTPVTDAESDLWFLHKYFMSNFNLGTGVGFQEPSSRSYTLESKAMRKVNDDQDVVLVAELGSPSQGFNLQVAGRVLIKEH